MKSGAKGHVAEQGGRDVLRGGTFSAVGGAEDMCRS